MTGSGRESVHVEKIQKTFKLQIRGDHKIPTLITCIPSQCQCSRSQLSDQHKGLIFVTGPCLVHCCTPIIDYMHRNIPEIIKVESDPVVLLKGVIPSISIILHSGIIGWSENKDKT